MQTIELQKMGLMELQHEECEQVNGGNWIKWVLQQVIIHSEEIGRGFEKGWNFDNQKN
jgi:hypothetical protein